MIVGEQKHSIILHQVYTFYQGEIFLCCATHC